MRPIKQSLVLCWNLRVVQQPLIIVWSALSRIASWTSDIRKNATRDSTNVGRMPSSTHPLARRRSATVADAGRSSRAVKTSSSSAWARGRSSPFHSRVAAAFAIPQRFRCLANRIDNPHPG